MLADYLCRHGYTAVTAGDDSEMDTCLAERMPDLLIVDVNMPGESGFEIARRVRATSDVPILMLTAADDVVDRVVGLGAHPGGAAPQRDATPHAGNN
jgi:two-component system phosphate regulon response regulator OmpR